MNAALIEKIRHICVKSGVPETVMGAICHEVRYAPVSTTGPSTEAVRWANRMKHYVVEPDTRAAADYILSIAGYIEALRPFADYYKAHHAEDKAADSKEVFTRLTLGDFRRAAAFVSAIGTPK